MNNPEELNLKFKVPNPKLIMPWDLGLDINSDSYLKE